MNDLYEILKKHWNEITNSKNYEKSIFPMKKLYSKLKYRKYIDGITFTKFKNEINKLIDEGKIINKNNHLYIVIKEENNDTKNEIDNKKSTIDQMIEKRKNIKVKRAGNYPRKLDGYKVTPATIERIPLPYGGTKTKLIYICPYCNTVHKKESYDIDYSVGEFILIDKPCYMYTKQKNIEINPIYLIIMSNSEYTKYEYYEKNKYK